MLGAAFQYSYINAKVRSLKSELLNQPDYDHLARVSGCNGMVEYLKTTSYGKRWDNLPTSYDGLIQLYYKDLFQCYKKVINILSGNKQRLIEHFYQKYELENLKLILRLVCLEKQSKKWNRLILPTVAPESFSVRELLQCKNLDDILYCLRGTWYYDSLQNSRHRFEEERETFPLEMALDLSYYSRLWQITLSLGHRDTKIARSLVGVQLDILNIFWIFRFKEIFHFSPKKILNYSLMQGLHLSSDIRLKLAYAIDHRDVVANLSGTPYKNLLIDVEDPEICYAKLLSYEYFLAKKNWNMFPFHIGTVLDYVLFKEIEVRDLVSFTEAKRLNLPHEKVRHYLIHSYVVKAPETYNAN